MKHYISLFSASAVLYYFLFPLCVDMYSAAVSMNNPFTIAIVLLFIVIILTASTLPAVVAVVEIMETKPKEE